MIVGTAGHIDHGKTALIGALTGRNTDRLPEEQRRGISIELGYAFVPVDGGEVLAFVDVPGHEKFVPTMLSGATGIDLALLVIAADDGVMPQTEEHLDILRLLGISAGAIALTKIDAVEPGRVDAARAEIGRWLQGSAEASWPLFAVSSRSGAGLAGLATWLRERAAATTARAVGGSFRLAIDRAFTLTGIGTVVTGTVHSGRVREGDEVTIAPSGARARVRSIHAQDRPVREGKAGERCALNLSGLARDEAPRGAWVQAASLDNVRTRFDAALRLSARERTALGSPTSVHLHHGTGDVLARISLLDRTSVEPNAAALVGVAAAAPLPLCRGDRFALRDASGQRTIAGGIVLDIDPPARYRRAPARLALLAALRDDAPRDALAAWLAVEPVAVARWRAGWNLGEDDAAALLAANAARVFAGTAFSPAAWDELGATIIAAVAATHEREPEMPGLEQNRLRRIAGARIESEAFAGVVDDLLARGVLVQRGAFVALPTHVAELARDERMRWERIKPLLIDAPFCPPRVRDIARHVGSPEGDVRSLLRKVARVGEVTLVALDHFFLTEAVAALADRAGELGAAGGVVRAAPFRDRIGGGRKVAIQILEFFDRSGYTRRIRDDHLIRRDNPWRATQQERR